MNMEINGVTLQADFMDADFMETFEPALIEMKDGINACKTMNVSIAANYKAMIQLMDAFFDKSFGEGTSVCIFGNSKNVMARLEAVTQIDEAYKAEKKQLSNFTNRYTQRQNNFQSMQGHQKKQKPQHYRP